MTRRCIQPYWMSHNLSAIEIWKWGWSVSRAWNWQCMDDKTHIYCIQYGACQGWNGGEQREKQRTGGWHIHIGYSQVSVVVTQHIFDPNSPSKVLLCLRTVSYTRIYNNKVDSMSNSCSSVEQYTKTCQQCQCSWPLRVTGKAGARWSQGVTAWGDWSSDVGCRTWQHVTCKKYMVFVRQINNNDAGTYLESTECCQQQRGEWLDDMAIDRGKRVSVRNHATWMSRSGNKSLMMLDMVK